MTRRKRDSTLLYAAQLLLECAGGSMQRTNLLKALFYLDLVWLRDRGETLTGSTYVAIDHGPVIDNYKEVLIDQLIQNQIAHEECVQVVPGIVSKPLTLLVSPERPEDEHLDLLARQIAEFVGGKKAVDISEFTHENLAWQAAIKRGNGTPINMILALGQITKEDPWLDDPLSAQERAALTGLEHGSATLWD